MLDFITVRRGFFDDDSESFRLPVVLFSGKKYVIESFAGCDFGINDKIDTYGQFEYSKYLIVYSGGPGVVGSPSIAVLSYDAIKNDTFSDWFNPWDIITVLKPYLS